MEQQKKEAIFSDLEKAVEESLTANRQKELDEKAEEERKQRLLAEEVAKAEAEYQRLEEVQMQRESLVTNETASEESCINIHVRHISLGRIQRLFSTADNFRSVYNWVGSLHHEPELFRLFAVPSVLVKPENLVDDMGTLNMVRCSKEECMLDNDNGEDSVIIGPDGSVETETDENDTLPIEELQNETPENAKTTTRMAWETLENTRLEARGKLEASSTYEDGVAIRRHFARCDLLGIYSEDEILSSNLSFKLKDENAVGDGVNREVSGLFW